MKPYLLDQCPGCGHGEILAAFPGGPASDNSLGRLLKRADAPALPGFNLAAHARSEWSVCGHCALMFARSRPQADGLEAWYPPLFQLSEERGYNTAPLPQTYIDGKRRGAEKLFQDFDALGLFAGATSLIHFRTGPGHFLDIVRRKYPALEVYGLEYFEHPAAFAQSLVGSNRVARISAPEPVSPFPVQRFDLIIANHFLTHAHEPRKFLGYLRGLLSDTGTLVLYNELDHDLSFASMTAYPRGLNFFHKQLYTRSSLNAFVRSCGFAPEEISKPKNGKPSKYITLRCTPADPAPAPASEPEHALRLLRTWRRKHRLYRALRWVIDPVRRLISR